jgi:phosphomannomutase
MSALCEKIDADNFILNEKIDGDFPAHHPDPSVAENMQQLIELVKRENCDIGIAFDGDGDRIGVVDEAGNILWGDQLMSIFASDILTKKPGAKIIADVKTSQNLFGQIENEGGQPIMWKTGHSLIKKKMSEENADLAGEMSGHIFFADNNGFDDGLYAAVRILNIIAETDEKISEMIAKIPQTFDTGELRIQVDEAKKFAIIENVQNNLAQTGLEVCDIDGVRVNTADGWFLIRASNTQAVLVARCESKSEEGLTRLKKQLDEVLAICCG